MAECVGGASERRTKWQLNRFSHQNHDEWKENIDPDRFSGPGQVSGTEVPTRTAPMEVFLADHQSLKSLTC